MKEDGGAVQPTKIVGKDYTEEYFAVRERREEKNKNMEVFLNICLKYSVDKLFFLVKKRRQDQGLVQSLRSVHLSISRSRFFAGGHTPCMNVRWKTKHLAMIARGFPSPAQYVLASDTLGRSKIMRNIFVDCQR